MCDHSEEPQPKRARAEAAPVHLNVSIHGDNNTQNVKRPTGRF